MKGEIMKGAVEIVPDVKLDLNVQSDDVVSIYVASEEDRLIKAEGSLMAEEDTLAKRNEEIRRLTDKLVDQHGEKAAAGRKTEIEKAMKAIKIKTTTNVGVQMRHRNGKLTIYSEINMTLKSSNVSGDITVSITTSLPKKIKDLMNEKDANEKRIEAIREGLAKVRLDLLNIPRMERKARAKLGAAVLSSTKQGRQLLENVMAKKLPAPKE